MTKEAAIRCLSRMWLFGTLFRVDRRTYAGAFYEFTYLLLWSVLPFVLGALVLYVTSSTSGKNFYEFGLDTFRNGELLVFTISMLAPILYLTLHEPEQQSDKFPHKLPISTVVALIIVTCASLFATLKASAVKDFPFVFELSVTLTIIALLFRYLAILYHRYRMPQLTETDLRAPEKSFVDAYRRHTEASDATKPDFADNFDNYLKGQQ